MKRCIFLSWLVSPCQGWHSALLQAIKLKVSAPSTAGAVEWWQIDNHSLDPTPDMQ